MTLAVRIKCHWGFFDDDDIEGRFNPNDEREKLCGKEEIVTCN